MNILYTCMGWLVELAVFGGLVWIHIRIKALGVQDFNRLIFIILLPILGISHWIILRANINIRKMARLKLALLTGPSIFLCFVLVLNVGIHFRNIKSGIVPKNVQQEAIEKEIPMRYWIENNTERIESELISYILLLACLGVIYKIRYTVSDVQSNNRSNLISKNIHQK